MLKILKSLSIEVTRRCNEKCNHCMRGEAQNLDISLDDIDNILNDNNLIIRRLIFSGGEPTLAPDIIIATVDKIINERKKVLGIHITTNGLIYSEELITSLERFATYSKTVLGDLQKMLELQDIIDIRLSNDHFHQIPSHNKYQQITHPDFHIYETGDITFLDDNLLMTGRLRNCFIDDPFIYSLKATRIGFVGDTIYIDNDYYLTATGFITNRGDGEYTDMDAINFGPIATFSFDQVIKDYFGKSLKK